MNVEPFPKPEQPTDQHLFDSLRELFARQTSARNYDPDLYAVSTDNASLLLLENVADHPLLDMRVVEVEVSPAQENQPPSYLATLHTPTRHTKSAYQRVIRTARTGLEEGAPRWGAELVVPLPGRKNFNPEHWVSRTMTPEEIEAYMDKIYAAGQNLDSQDNVPATAEATPRVNPSLLRRALGWLGIGKKNL